MGGCQTGEPPELADEAKLLMKRVDSGDVRLGLTPLIVAEVLWVLKSFYGYRLPQIREVLISLLLTPGIETEDLDLTVEALNLAADQNVDFVDACLSLKAQAVGEAVCTFDASDFRRLPASWSRPSQIGGWPELESEEVSEKPIRITEALGKIRGELTQRQQKIFEYGLDGLTQREIAELLGLSPSMIGAEVKAIEGVIRARWPPE